MRLLIVLAATLMLQGCWAVFIPTGAIADAVSGNEGRNCVDARAQVGDKIRLADGKVGTVQKLEGASSRCTDSRWPIRAVLSIS